MAKSKYLEQPAKEDLEAKTIDKIIDEAPKKPKEEIAIEDMPLNSLSDYVRYNRRARELNKKYSTIKGKIVGLDDDNLQLLIDKIKPVLIQEIKIKI